MLSVWTQQCSVPTHPCLCWLFPKDRAEGSSRGWCCRDLPGLSLPWLSGSVDLLPSEGLQNLWEGSRLEPCGAEKVLSQVLLIQWWLQKDAVPA